MATLKPSTSVFKTIVRIATPWVISAVVWTSQRLGFHVNAGTATEVAAIVGTSITLVVPPLEAKWKWFGLLLGWVGAPTYTASVSKAQLEAELAALQAQLNSGTGPAPGTPVAITLTPNA
jgi:hypothetical protein